MNQDHQHYLQHHPVSRPLPSQLRDLRDVPAGAVFDSSDVLRQEAQVIRYNAHIMIQRSRLLEAHADMLDIERGNNAALLHQPPVIRDNQPVSDTASQVEVVPKEEPLDYHEQPQENVSHNKSIETEVIRRPNYQAMATIEHDVKQLIEAVSYNSTILDENVFESNIFKEADQLLNCNVHFAHVLNTVVEDIDTEKRKFTKIRKIDQAPDEQNCPMNLSKSQEPERKEMLKNISLTQLLTIPDCSLTSEEVSWTERMHKNIANTFKLLIRPDFYKAVMDLQLGRINKMDFLRILAGGRNLQAYAHLLTMISLPYFHSISVR